MPNYLTPPDAQQQAQIQEQISNRQSAGIYGRKILGDCAGLQDGIDAQVFRDTKVAPWDGSKPVALHTEFAKETAIQKKPYAANSEIVFYLMKAGGGPACPPGQVENFNNPFSRSGRPVYQNNFSSGSPSALSMQAAEQAPQSAEFGSAVQTGPAENMQNIETQTPMNQVAVKSTVDRLDIPVSTSAAAGPLTGLNIEQLVPVGANTQFGAEMMSPTQAAANLTEYKYSAKERTESMPASQILFADILQRSFNPSFDLAGADQISGSIARGSISSLAARLAFATNGVTNSRDLIEAINNGRVGFSTPMATLQARRLGPEVLLETTTTSPRRPYSGATTYGAA